MRTVLTPPTPLDMLSRLSLTADAVERAFPAPELPSLVGERPDGSERTRFALDAARAGVWDADLGTGRVTWSQTMHGVMGLPTGAFGGTVREMIAAVHPDDRRLVGPAFRVQGDEPRDFEIDVRVVWPDGSTHVVQLRGRVAAGTVGRAALVVGVAQDVTERLQLEQQLRQSQKMAAMGRFAGGVAHDFNNILTAILGYAVLIEDDPIDEGLTRAHAGQIRRAAEKAAALTRQLLAFSRRQAVERRTLHVSNVVNDLVPMVVRVLGEHILISRDLDPDLHLVFADAGQLEQILLNLAINGREAMASGGQLAIRTSNLTVGDGDVVARPPLAPGEYATLTVSDTGIGMDAATCERIFEPFFTTKEVGHGTGLGLSTVYEIVKSMSGGICVASEPGVGTSFRVYLPKSEATFPEPPVSALQPLTESRQVLDAAAYTP